MTSQSISFVRSRISLETASLLTSESSSSSTYIVTLSLPPPIRLIVELPPMLAPIVSMPLISEILSMTSLEASFNSSNVKFSPSFAAIDTEIWFVSISMSMKFMPFERLSAALPARSTTATIKTIGLKRRHPARNLPYASRIASNHG